MIGAKRPLQIFLSESAFDKVCACSVVCLVVHVVMQVIVCSVWCVGGVTRS